MEFILELLSEKEEQVKLAGIIISATIAIAVVLLNHIFTIRRSTKEKKVEKIEKLYISAKRYSSDCYKVLSLLPSHFRENPDKAFSPPRDLINSVSESIMEIEMIIQLYFPTINIDVDRLNLFNLAIFKEDEFAESRQELSANQIKNNYQYLTEICSNLMNSVKKI